MHFQGNLTREVIAAHGRRQLEELRIQKALDAAERGVPPAEPSHQQRPAKQSQVVRVIRESELITVSIS